MTKDKGSASGQRSESMFSDTSKEKSPHKFDSPEAQHKPLTREEMTDEYIKSLAVNKGCSILAPWEISKLVANTSLHLREYFMELGRMELRTEVERLKKMNEQQAKRTFNYASLFAKYEKLLAEKKELEYQIEESLTPTQHTKFMKEKITKIFKEIEVKGGVTLEELKKIKARHTR